jgi:hypothetical protein
MGFASVSTMFYVAFDRPFLAFLEARIACMVARFVDFNATIFARTTHPFKMMTRGLYTLDDCD